MRTRCDRVLTRCISTRDSAAFHTARCAKPSMSKSAPSSRLIANEQVAVERRRHAERIVVGEQQVALRLHQIGADQQRVARPQRARGSSAATRRRPADRSCRCSIRGTATSVRPRRRWRDRARRARLRTSPDGDDRSASSASSVRVASRARPARRRPDGRSATPSTAPAPHERRQLLAAAGPELDDRRQRRDALRESRERVRGQQAPLRAVMRYHGSCRSPRTAPSPARRRDTATAAAAASSLR